jgi:hypothetical protein
MYNKITLIGTMADHPQAKYDPDANLSVCISLIVPPPLDSSPTYWGLVFDLRPLAVAQAGRLEMIPLS